MSKGPLASTATGMPHHAQFEGSFENEAEMPTSEGPVGLQGGLQESGLAEPVTHGSSCRWPLWDRCRSKLILVFICTAGTCTGFLLPSSSCMCRCAKVCTYMSQRVIWRRCFLPYGSPGPNTGCQCAASTLTCGAISAALFLSETGSC